jgi:hypothetical protein
MISRVSQGIRRLFLCALLALPACERAQDEQPTATPVREEELAVLVPSLVDAIPSKQVRFVMEHVSPAFKEEGGLDYYDVRSLVEKAAMREDVIGARLESSTLTEEPEGRQRVSARVAFAPGQRLGQGDALPEGGVVYAIELVFEKSGAKWQAVGGRYRRESPPMTSPATSPMATR